MTETENPAGPFGREPEERVAFPEQAPGRPEDDFFRPVPEREARSGFFAPGHGEAGEGYVTPAHGETGGDAPAPGKGEAGRDHSFGGQDLAEAFAPGDDDDTPVPDARLRDFAPDTGDDDFAPENGGSAFAPESGGRALVPENGNGDFASEPEGEDASFASENGDDDVFASEAGDNGAAPDVEFVGAETGVEPGAEPARAERSGSAGAEAGALPAPDEKDRRPVEGADEIHARPGEAGRPEARGKRYLGIRLRKAGQVFFFPDEQLSVRVGSKVIVEFEQGSAFGEVDNILYSNADGDPTGQPAPGRILGLATARDIALHAENRILSGEATAFCTTCIRQRSLDMKLVDVEVLHDRSKIIFYFTAPAHIDFRELVKDLVRNYRTRIELRQIGVRHETQMVGGIGNCGMVCCCHQYLRKFAPVTIKMAKEQNLFLNPAKLSGMCGRLLCCLSFEQSNYEEFNRRCPKLGKRYATSDGTFRIVRANMFSRTIVVCSDAGEERELTLDEWADIAPRRAEGPAPDAPQGPAQQPRRASADGGRKPRSRSRDERRHGGKTGEHDPAESSFTADAAEDGAFSAGWDRDDPLDFAGQERPRERRDHRQRDDRPQHGNRPQRDDRPQRDSQSQRDDRPRPDSAPAASPVPPDDETPLS